MNLSWNTHKQRSHTWTCRHKLYSEATNKQLATFNVWSQHERENEMPTANKIQYTYQRNNELIMQTEKLQSHTNTGWHQTIRRVILSDFYWNETALQWFKIPQTGSKTVQQMQLFLSIQIQTQYQSGKTWMNDIKRDWGSPCWVQQWIFENNTGTVTFTHVDEVLL